jgi:Spy/CpxP family protein refolding chaperone
MNLKRTILVATLLMASTIPSFAQRVPAGPAFGNRIFITDTFTRALPDPISGVQQALSLTASQVESVKTLLQTRMQSTQALLTEIEQKRSAFETLSNQANPSPAEVGTAWLALHAAEEKLTATHTKFAEDFANLLTADQRKLVEDAKAAAARVPALAAIGLLEGPQPFNIAIPPPFPPFGGGPAR